MFNFVGFKNKIINSIVPCENEKKNRIKIFLVALTLSAIIFLPIVIYNKGILFLYGDFNSQQIPFYTLAHDAIRNGEFGISWNTDLGSNFIGSYSFYLLGSPFFWLTIPFPNQIVPYLMWPLLCLKFATASLFSYMFIRRFTKTPHSAFLGALIYSFSGYSIYNSFFNHFHEIIAFFPLILFGFEELITNKKKGLFAITIALNLIVNFYFFVAEIVFLFLYAVFRCFTKKFKIDKKTFISIILEFIIGCLIGSILFFPAAIMTLENPRVKYFLFSHSAFIYNEPQKYGLILYSMFFPPDMPAFANCFSGANAWWQSVAAYVPMFSMTGIIAFLKKGKNSWLKKLTITLLIFATIPILNSLFNGLNGTYYARWFFSLTLIFALITAISIERYLEQFKSAIKISFVFMLCFSAIGIFPTKVNGKLKFFGIPRYKAMFWINFSIAVLGLLLVFIFFILKQKKYITIENIYRKFILIFCSFIVAYSFIEISYGSIFFNTNNNYETIMKNGLLSNIKNDPDLKSNEFYRIDIWPENEENLNMLFKIPSISTFHSTVPASIMQFYINLGLERDVFSKIPEGKNHYLRSFLSVKYILIKNENKEEYEKKLPPYFKFLKTRNDFSIYENQNFLKMGFIQNKYIDINEFNKIKKEDKDKILLKAVVLSKEQIEKNKDILKPISKNELENLYANDLEDEIKNLQKNSCEYFKTHSYGFKAKINSKKDGLLVFSTPYEYTYTAYINNKKADIEKINSGLMAVRCKKGENIVEFKYRTPGLRKTIYITIFGAFCYISYMATLRFLSIFILILI